MKTHYFVFAMLIMAFVSCSKNQGSIPEDTKATVNGETFTPNQSSAKKSGNNLILSFESGTKKIEILTSDTISGTYTIVSQSLKSASALKANIIYTDGTNSYFGTGGLIEIIRSNSGTISGTYHATVANNGTEIEISAGSFASLELVNSSPLIGSETAINDSLLACYAKFHEYIELLYLFDAIYANHVPAPNSTWNEIYDHNQTQSSSNEKILKLWSDTYEIIYRSNLIIESSTSVITDQNTLNSIIGQAKAMRAYLYDNLLNWFGEVPLQLEISEQMIPRNNISEVLNQIYNDADMADQNLPVSWSQSEKFRFPKSFAQGLLARAYLNNQNIQDYTKVSIKIQEIINSGVYALSTNTANFISTSTEIFCGFEKTNNIEFNSFFNKGSYVPVIRYTEAYLIAAEALFYTGQTSNAINYINMLNNRGGRPTLSSLTADDLFEQWNTELMKEGSMFVTLKRYNKALPVVQNYAHKLLLPIPLPVIINNVYLTQNPGY